MAQSREERNRKRRERYARNKDVINARRRKKYAEEKRRVKRLTGRVASVYNAQLARLYRKNKTYWGGDEELFWRQVEHARNEGITVDYLIRTMKKQTEATRDYEARQADAGGELMEMRDDGPSYDEWYFYHGMFS